MVDDDNDFDHQKRARQTNEQHGYDGPDEEDREIIRQEDEQENGELNSDIEPQADSRIEDEKPRQSPNQNFEQINLNDMKHINHNLVKFTFDATNGKWCEIELEVT